MERKDEGEHITCIAKDMICSLFEESQKSFDDGTGYIKSVKAIIQGLEAHADENENLKDFDRVFKKIRNFSKQLWIKNITGDSREDSRGTNAESDNLYYDYCFEYIFEKGEYPL